jgi:hypothetical protein
MGVLRARVGGAWVDIGGDRDQVWVNPSAPTDPNIELWYDTDAPSLLAPAVYAGRNLLNNGQMAVNQRQVTSVAALTSNVPAADRHWIQNNGIGTIACSYVQNIPANFSVEVPAGRPRPGQIQYLSVATAEAAGALAAGDYLRWQQAIEGINLQHLGWGTPQAQPVTVSFDVYSSVASTFVAELYRIETQARHSAQTFTVVAGFQTVTMTFPGDQTTLVTNDSGARLYLFIYLGAGSNLTSAALSLPWRNFVAGAEATGVSNNWAAGAGSVFALTNMQLEVGAAATPYEVRSISDELRDCQRYFERIGSTLEAVTPFGVGMNYNTNTCVAVVPFLVRKRVIPTVTYAAAALFSLYTSAGAVVALNSITTHSGGTTAVLVTCGTNATQVAGDATILRGNNNTSAFIDVSAEI